MAWDVPITVDGKTYNVRFDGEEKPTPQEIQDATAHVTDPQRGQTLGEGLAANLEQGFQTGLAQTFVTGPGAVAEAMGMEDNAMLQAGKELEASIQADSPVSVENQKSFPVKAAGAIGQAASMAVVAPLAGAGTGFRAASLAGKARQIALMGGLAGSAAGEQEATRLGVTDPLNKAALIMGTGALEFGSELLGGYAAETALPSAVGAFLKGKKLPSVPGIVKGMASEGGEEIGAGVSQRALAQALANEDPTRPGFTPEGQPIYAPWDAAQMLEEGSLGAVAGGALVGAAHVFNALTPQQQQDSQNVAGLPQQMRKAAYEALQKVTAKEATAVKMADAVDEGTAAAMRVAIDGQRATILEEAAKVAASEFAPGWQEREKAALVHRSDEADTFFEGGNWMIQTGVDAEGQPLFKPAPNAAELEKTRQEYIQTGDLGEGMQPIIAPPVAPAAPAEPAPTPTTATGIANSPAPKVPARSPRTIEPRPARNGRDTTERDAWDEKYGGMRKNGRTHNDDGTPYQPTVLDVTMPRVLVGLSGNTFEQNIAAVGVDNGIELNTAVAQLLDDGWQWDDTARKMVNPANPEERPADGLQRIRKGTQTPATPPSVAPEAPSVALPPESVPPAVDPESARERAILGDYRYNARERVKQVYPNSPELVAGIENAIGDASAKAFLDANEPRAQLREELATMDSDAIEEMMREEGVDENGIRMATSGAQIDKGSALEKIMHARAMQQEPTPPPQSPKKPEKKKAARIGSQDPVSRTMRSREFKNNPSVSSDIISRTREGVASAIAPPRLVVVKEKGKKARLELAPEFRGGEWDWYRPLLEDPVARRIVHEAVFSENATTSLDTAASHFGMRGDEYGEAVAAAALERVRIAKEMAAGEGLTEEERIMAQMERDQLAKEKASAPIETDPFKATFGQEVPRVQPDEFESRMRERIAADELDGWTDAAIRDAIRWHETKDKANPPTPEIRDMVDAIEEEMLSADEGNPYAGGVWDAAMELSKPTPKKNAPPELRRSIGLGAYGVRHVEFQSYPSVDAFAYVANAKKMSNAKTSPEQRKAAGESAKLHMANLRAAFPSLTEAEIRKAAQEYSQQVIQDSRGIEEGEKFTAYAFQPAGPPVDTAPTFVKNASELPEDTGRAFVIAPNGAVTIITDRVHVTLADRRAARKSGKTAAAVALNRVIAQAQTEAMTPEEDRPKFSTQRPSVTSRGVHSSDVQSAVRGLSGILPNVDRAWTGTRRELNDALRADPEFQRSWKDDWQANHPGTTRIDANEAFNDFLTFGLDGQEGFTARGRTYLITDQVAVTEADGSPAGAVRRVLIHEDAHEGLDHLRSIDKGVENTWQALRNGIRPSELDDLADRLYPGLRDWRSDTRTHDDLAHEWFAAKIAEIEKRGMPEPGSLIGKFMAWLRGVFQRLMGTETSPNDAALLDFMDASRQARAHARMDAARAGVRYSAATPEGDIPPREIESQIEGEPAGKAQAEPQKARKYNLWSEDHRAAYEAWNNSPHVPDDMKHFAQVLGGITKDVRITQNLQPMREMSNRRLGSIHGEFPEINPENTALAYADAQGMQTRATFARNYIEEFQTWHAPRDPETGEPLHMGDAAVAVHQLNLMHYAIRLLAQTGDRKLFTQMAPFMNDVIMGDFATASSAARIMNVRSIASRNGGAGIPTALELAHGTMHEAAASKDAEVGAEGLRQLALSLSSPEVRAEIEAGMAEFLGRDGADIAEKISDADEGYSSEGYLERAWAQMDAEERALAQQYDEVLRRLAELEEISRALDAESGRTVRPSMAGNKREDLEYYRGRRDALEAAKKGLVNKAKELLRKLTASDTSSESKEKRRKRSRTDKDGKPSLAHKVLSANDEMKKLIDRYENRNKRTKRDVPPWKKTFEQQVKAPTNRTAFVEQITKQGATEQTANVLFDTAAKLHEEGRSKSSKRKATTDAERFEKEANRIIDEYAKAFSDTPTWSAGKTNDLRALKSQFIAGKLTEAQFVAKAADLGVNTRTIANLVDVMQEDIRRRAATENAREIAGKEESLQRIGDSAAKGPPAKGAPGSRKLTGASLVTAITRQILREPLMAQRMKTVVSATAEGDPEVSDGDGYANPWNPDWVRQAFSNAFVEHGMTRAEADAAADKLSSKFDAIMRRAQEKAMLKAGKELDVAHPTMKKIMEAVRSTAIDPMNANPVVKALAEKAGFKGLTQADFQRLAQLDETINSAVPTLVAKAYTEVSRILARVRPSKSKSRIMEQLFINGALSSLGVLQLNWAHPVYILPRLLINDLAGVLGDAIANPGKGSRTETLKLAAYAFTSMWHARQGMISDAMWSLKNDAYTTRMIELLNLEHSLYKELMDAMGKFTTGTVAERAIALPKILWLSSDWVRRMLSSADQMWGNVIQNYVFENEAMRSMVQDAGMTTEAAGLVVLQATRNGEKARQDHEALTGDRSEAALVGRDIMRESLSRGLDYHLKGTEAERAAAKEGRTPGQVTLKTAEKASEMELGNRRGEDSPWWDLPNTFLESFKSAASAVRNKMDSLGVPLGRAVTGFVSVASNILNRSVYLTPLGMVRVMAKLHANPAMRAKIYKETMATEGMIRARLYESITSTVALTLLGLLRYLKDDKEEGMVITGNGPKNPAMREAWLKAGHKPGFIEFRDSQGNVIVGLPYTRGGFDHAAIALTTIGALDDMDLDDRKGRAKDFNWGLAYTQQIFGNQVKQAQFFGVRAIVGSVPSSQKPNALSGWVGYTANPWTPWGGLTKSVFKAFTGAQEEGSVKAAFYSNVPVVQLMTGDIIGPRLNYLGDQIGGQPDETLKKMAERASYAGFPMYLAFNPDTKDEDIYDFLLAKGVAPAFPGRSDLESKNGPLDDERWAEYVTTRGDLLKADIRRSMARIQKMDGADAESEMAKISRRATLTAKHRLKLE